MKFSAGNFAIEVWQSGWPRWCQVHHQGSECIRGLQKGDLLDLQYAVGRALDELARLEQEDERRKQT